MLHPHQHTRRRPRGRQTTPHLREKLLQGAVLALALGLLACASGPDETRPTSAAGTTLVLREDAASILVPGEECVYGVAWEGVLPVGRVIYRTSRQESREGAFLVYEGITEAAAFVSAFLEAGGTTRVLVDPKTFLPLSVFWVTADPKNPHTRTTWFDRKRDRAWTAKFSPDFVQTRVVQGADMVEPLAAIYLARVLDWPPEEPEIRLLVVEGADLHLMTLRLQGHETLLHHKEAVPTLRLSVQTHRLGDDGRLLDEEPWNRLFVWVAETPGRPILRMTGTIPFGNVTLNLARRTGGSEEAAH